MQFAIGEAFSDRLGLLIAVAAADVAVDSVVSAPSREERQMSYFGF